MRGELRWTENHETSLEILGYDGFRDSLVTRVSIVSGMIGEVK